MLRALVLVLVLVNGAFYAWTQGWLDGVVGVRASGDREPERLARQVRPESMQILPPGSASAAAATAASAAAPALACLEAGPFAATEVAAAEAALRTALPAGSWVPLKTDHPGAWLVYMGRYPNREGMAKKEDELRRIKVAFEEMQGAAELEPGLVLGRFDDRGNADAALATLTLRGIHTARIVERAAPTSTYLLRVDRAGPALAAQVGALHAEALGKGFAVCSAADSVR